MNFIIKIKNINVVTFVYFIQHITDITSLLEKTTLLLDQMFYQSIQNTIYQNDKNLTRMKVP